jgi:probable addiction module antidote protein
MKNAVKYEDILRQYLQNSELAAEYLTACLEEGPDIFLVGLRNVVAAQGGMRRTARSSKLNRESLYRLLSQDGNPRLSSLNAVLTSLGLKVRFTHT